MTSKKYLNHGHITQKEFEKILDMKKMGLKISQIHHLTNWSLGAVALWIQYPTWEKYCEFKETLKKPRVTKATVTASLPVKPEFAQGLKKAAENQTVISALMEIANEIHLLRLAWEKPGNKVFFDQKPVNPEEVGLPANNKKSWMPFGRNA